MKIICLVENTSSVSTLRAKHGLSLYIETKKHKILFDIGPDNTFVKNAKKLNIDLSKVDTVIISHGHFDHGGGLKYFLEINNTAPIYIKKEAFEKHYTNFLGIKIDIGLHITPNSEYRYKFVEDQFAIDDELALFSNVTGRKLFSYMNGPLEVKKNNKIERDKFDHEQYLLIKQENNNVLFTGCSHNGIVNILEKYDEINIGHKETIVMGGLHLYNPVNHKYESNERINDIAAYLKNRTEQFYTCHCTGKKAYNLMKEELNNKLNYVCTGSSLII